MCGISGWVDYNYSVYEEDGRMALMSRAVSARGPDADGIWKSKECYLIHRRLIIIDKENGKQPMVRGKYIITYNGQLYNTEEVRQKLKKEGCVFSGYSDTEVVLNAYIKWGEACLSEFNGIFAFAIWNDESKTLFLARDRIGVKPLFFYRYNGGLIFGSELKALFENDKVPREIDENGIASLMLLGPARKCGCAVFKGIDELMPGCFAVLSRDGFETRRYWHIKASPHTESLDETAAHLRELVVDSVERQLVSDIPLCTFLSGGLDSSIITVIAAEKLKTEGKQLTTYSVDYRDNRINFKASSFQPDEDAPWIEQMSKFTNSIQKNVIIDTPQLTESLYDAVNARDLPGMADVDGSLYLFMKAVKKEFSLGLSGECADEILGGYPWYHNEEILYADGFPWSRSVKERSELLRPGVIGGIDPLEYVNSACRETVNVTEFLGTDTPKERRIREMFMLNFYWFMQTLIDRGDRMAAANGLELRVPFCDYRIVEYAYNIPWEMRAFGGREKGLVRHAMQDLLPEGVAWRKKSPYPKTHNPEYLKNVIDIVDGITKSSECRIAEILDIDKIRGLTATGGKCFEKNWYGQLMQSPQMFAYLIQLEHWLRHYNVKILK